MLTLESGPARLVIAPEKGGRIVAFSVDGLDLLVTPDLDDHNFGCFPMVPWAGRVRHGSFDFDGQRYQLPLNNPPHAIHGTARARDEDGIPTGELGPIGPHPWDDCFTKLGDRPAVLRRPGAISVTLETSCRCVVVFDEPEHAICVEPQSGPPDAFNLGPTVVRPGEPLVATASWSWKLENG